MAERNPPIFLQAGSHPAEDTRRALHSLVGGKKGIVGVADLLVTEKAGTPNMSVDVAAGACWILGTENTSQGAYYCEARTLTNLAIAAADATNPRIDLVVAKVQDAAYSGATNAWSLAVVTGTPAVSPVAPAAPASSLVLARVSVPAADTVINNAQITDYRLIDGLGRASGLGGLIVVADSASRPSSPYEGMRVYELASKRYMVYNGSAWRLDGGSSSTARAGCRVRKSTDSIISTGGGGTFFGFDVEEVDTDAFHSTSVNTTRITVPSGFDGLYHVRGYYRWDATGPGAAGSLIFIAVNGTIIDRTMSPAAAPFLGQQISTVLRLAAGDYVELGVYQSSGSNKTVSAIATDSSLDPKSPVLEVWWVGP